MAQSGYTPIKLYYSSTASATPNAANLEFGELALNITASTDGKLYYKDSAGNVQLLAARGANLGTSATTQVLYNNAGVVAGSANLTFNGTALSGAFNGTIGATTPATGAFTTATARAAATQDAVTLQGRAGGTSSYAITITPTTLTANRTLTLPDETGTLILSGGALGTPSSGTVTNLTGTASININGTVGATTPTTGVFTTATARAAATQDSVILQGRAGGTSSYGVTLTPTTLTASRTLTLPDVTGTLSTLAGTETLTNKTLTNPTVTNYVETSRVNTAGTSVTIDLTLGTFQQFTISGGTATVTMPTAVAGKSFILILTQDSTPRTVTWSTVVWPSATPPSISSGSGKKDIFSFFSDGTNWYGATIGQNY
jgi:hypothetical protein